MVLVASFPKDCPCEAAGVVDVEEALEAPPPLHDISPSASMKTTRIEIETGLERRTTIAFFI